MASRQLSLLWLIQRALRTLSSLRLAMMIGAREMGVSRIDFFVHTKPRIKVIRAMGFMTGMRFTQVRKT
jgi:hypothetical protein